MDLRDPRCAGKAGKERFLRRVFTDNEAHDIRGAPDPDRALWVRWAAKEAAFKVVSKLLGAPPPFEHAAFRVEAPSSGSGSTGPGSVHYRELEVPYILEEQRHRIHVTAWEPGAGAVPPRLRSGVRRADELAGSSPPGWRERVVGRFTEREWEAIHGLASALVRIRARADLAGTLAVGESSIEIVCDDGPPGRSLPQVLLHGEESDVDISLSHHHGLLAWVFCVPEPDPQPERSER